MAEVPALALRVVIADPVAAARAALRRILETELGWTVVGEAIDGLGAIRTARAERADVLLVDSTVSGLDLASIQRLLPPDSGILVVGMTDRPESLAAAGGVSVMKSVPVQRLRTVVVDGLQQLWSDRHQVGARRGETDR